MGACISGASTAKPTKTSEVRIALVGQGESGKSTLFKQLKIIAARERPGQESFTREQRDGIAATIVTNMVSQMRILLGALLSSSGHELSPQLQSLASRLLKMEEAEVNARDPEIGRIMQQLWDDPAIKRLYANRDLLLGTVNDGCGYFWDNIPRVYSPLFCPTDDDILRIRVRTQGFEEAVYTYKDFKFRVTDLGGQRIERKHWPNIIEQSHTLLFVSALTEYDQRLREAGNRSRMNETFALLSEVMELAPGSAKALIIVLNKVDLFKEKMSTPQSAQAFKTYFTEYKGALEWEPAAAFVRKRFIDMVTPRTAFVHLTTALDTDNVSLIWKDIRGVTVKQLLSQSMAM